MTKLFRLILPVIFCLFFVAAAQKPPAVTFRLHGETSERDGDIFASPVAVGNPPIQVFVEKVPLISEREILAFYPFASPAGGYGVYFQLDNHGSKGLETLTTSRQGRFMVAFLNGRPLLRLHVDRPIRDGIVMIPSGISSDEVRAISQAFPLIGEDEAASKQRQRVERSRQRQARE